MAIGLPEYTAAFRKAHLVSAATCLFPLPVWTCLFARVLCAYVGGTHHAFADAGSGFCILNDLAYTATVLLQQGAVQRVLILDLDVHQVRMCAGVFVL